MSEPKIGDRIGTIGELREVIKHMDDADQICIETIDLESGDVQDLYPMYVDEIDGIKLTDGSKISEIRFCQMSQKEWGINNRNKAKKDGI